MVYNNSKSVLVITGIVINLIASNLFADSLYVCERPLKKGAYQFGWQARKDYTIIHHCYLKWTSNSITVGTLSYNDSGEYTLDPLPEEGKCEGIIEHIKPSIAAKLWKEAEFTYSISKEKGYHFIKRNCCSAAETAWKRIQSRLNKSVPFPFAHLNFYVSKLRDPTGVSDASEPFIFSESLASGSENDEKGFSSGGEKDCDTNSYRSNDNNSSDDENSFGNLSDN